MESYKSKNVVPLTIEISVVDPNQFYSSANEDSDYSDSGSDTNASDPCQPESNVDKTPEGCNSKSNETQLAEEAPKASDSANAAPQAESKSSSNENDNLPVPATSNEEEDLQPVELIDGIFDFVNFDANEDLALQEVEKEDKEFDLAAYITDQSESPTSSSEGSGKPQGKWISPTSSSQESGTSSGNSASPIPSTKDIQSNNPNGDAAKSIIQRAAGRGKDFATLVKCYKKEKALTDKSLPRKMEAIKSESEYKVKSLVKPVKVNDGNTTKEKDINPSKERDLKPVKSEAIKSANKNNFKSVKVGKPIIEAKVKPDKVKPIKESEVKALNENKMKQSTKSDVKPDKGNKPTEESDEILGKENKQRETEKNSKKPRKRSQVSPNSAEEVDSNLDDFTKAILSSMAVVPRKPNLEKRRNSGIRNRISHFQEHTPQEHFETYLRLKKEKSKACEAQPVKTQETSNPIPTLKGSTPPQQQQKMTTEVCAPIGNANTEELKTDNKPAEKRRISIQEFLNRRRTVDLKTPPQQQQNIKTEDCTPTANTGESRTSPKPQLNNKTETCATTENKEQPTERRKISFQEFMSRKRSHQSSNNDSDSNVVTKKRRDMA